MTQKDFFIKDIGSITVIKKKQIKNVSIRIKTDLSILVSIPFQYPFKVGKEFAVKKQSWINKHLEKIKQSENSLLSFDESTKFNTKNHSLILKRTLQKQISFKIDKKNVTVSIPRTMDFKDSFVQEAIKYSIAETLRIEAKEYIPARVEILAQKFGFNYNKVFLKNVKTRWGSCSAKNNINLNIHLMRLPNRLIDYVILHELVHTVHKNHSKKFWDELERVLPNSKTLDKEVNKYSSQRY